MLLALGVTTIVSYGTTQYLFGVLEVPLVTTFSWSRAEFSGAYALSLLIAGILGVPIGYLVDRFGARLLMTIGSVLAGCALIGLSQITSIVQLYLFWSGGLGIAMALILYPVTFTVVTSWFVTGRAKAFAVLTLIGGLASPIFIPLSGWLLQQVGWRATLFWYGILHLAIAVPLHGWLVRRALPLWVG
jgi:MFS family permease